MNLSLLLSSETTILLKRRSALSSEIIFSKDVIDGLASACWLGVGFFMPIDPYAMISLSHSSNPSLLIIDASV
jgi:hypothetical protein